MTKIACSLGDNTARPLALMKGVTTAWKPNVTCSVACSLSTNHRRMDQWRAYQRPTNLSVSFRTVTTCILYSAALQRTGSAADSKPYKYRLETACSLISGVMTNDSNQYLLSYTKMVRDELKQTTPVSTYRYNSLQAYLWNCTFQHQTSISVSFKVTQ